MHSRLALASKGAAKIITCIEDSQVVEKILREREEKGASPKASRRPPCRAKCRGEFDGGSASVLNKGGP